MLFAHLKHILHPPRRVLARCNRSKSSKTGKAQAAEQRRRIASHCNKRYLFVWVLDLVINS
jgi:hypothetical protein